MHHRTRNVNTAFTEFVYNIHTGNWPVEETDSRNGKVLLIPEPVTVTYTRPTERVLFNKARDANPFFHLYESLWMLAGRNDVAPLKHYARNIANYSDDGRTLNGAYGYRWRYASTTTGECFDQLKLLINHLRLHPESRRAVLQMWNVENDLLHIGDTIGSYSLDVCCNLSVCFSVRQARIPWGVGQIATMNKWLDMTVFNRSNDLVWGMLGANYVHFTMLQQYMADALNLRVGVYNHITNNLHVYLNNWEPESWISSIHTEYPESNEYLTKASLMNGNPADAFDRQANQLLNIYSGEEVRPLHVKMPNPWLHEVASPMFEAFNYHKLRDYDSAIRTVKRVAAADWRLAGLNWLLKRRDNYLTRLDKERSDTTKEIQVEEQGSGN